MTENQLPPWCIVFYIILYKIIISWNRASSNTPHQRNQPIQWPTFRPLLVLNAVTPIMILMLTLNIPMLNADIIPKPTPQTTTLLNLRNQMDDKNIQNKPHSGIKNHFIYDWQGDTVINPSIHNYTINYQACDIQILKQHLKNMIKRHSELCNYTLVSTTEQQHLICTQDDHHILLNKEMNIVQARQMCNNMNSKLIEVQNPNQTHLLDTFMTKHAINKTFSGIYLDSDIQAFLYTNGDYVNDRKSKDIPPLFCGYTNNYRSWKNLLKFAARRNYYKPIFLYSKAGTSNIVTLALNQHGTYATNNYEEQHISATAFPICATPRVTHSRDMIFQQWKNQCKTTHMNLETQIKATIKRITRLKPAALPKPTELIQLFGNYNYLLKTQNHTNNRQQDQIQTTTKCDNYRFNETHLKENNKKLHTSAKQPSNKKRHKCSLMALEFIPTAKFIYSAIQFFAQIYNNCIKNPYCETAKGTQTAENPPCGINQFFKSNKDCFYTRDTQQQNWFYQMENVI